MQVGEAVLAGRRDEPPSSNIGIAYTNLVGVLVEYGQVQRARDLALECRRRLGALMLDASIWSSLDTPALLHLDAGHFDDAARLAGASEREYSMHGQAERQPNEVRDRERLIGALRRELATSASTSCTPRVDTWRAPSRSRWRSRSTRTPRTRAQGRVNCHQICSPASQIAAVSSNLPAAARRHTPRC